MKVSYLEDTTSRPAASMLRQIERRLGQVAGRKPLAVLLVGLTPLLLRALLLPFSPIPEPRVQDEFSHLLLADTFAHGRLVNPVHPMWVHFESMHILVRPVYASIFPVAQGLVMAAAQALTGCPWIGVWLSVGLMCAALCWMLQGWLSPGWALLGGLLAAVRFGPASYWMNSYFGGAVAAAGGALVLGALVRLQKRSRWQDAAVMGVGLAILANSRPYEGLLLALPVGAALLFALRRKARPFPLLLPLLLILAVAAVALATYCARFSGNPFQLPYTFYRNTFTMAPHFIWQSPRPEPIYHHRVLRDYHSGWEMLCYSEARANRSPRGILSKTKSYWRFFLGPFLTIPFLTLPWLWKRRRPRFLLLTALLISAGLMVQVWDAPHYAAPAMGLVLLLAIEGLRQLRAGMGAWPVRLIALGCLLFPVVGGGPAPTGSGGPRAHILKQLESSGGRHLVIVRYARNHDVGDEWVYNSADIDTAPVVWAREMDPTSNRELLQYFRGRQVWLVQPDSRPVSLLPYDPSMRPDPPFRYVALGTDAITVLRSPEEVRRKILDRVAHDYTEPVRFNCDQWNYLFSEVTGVGSPDMTQACFAPGDRGEIVTFDRWFAWLRQQR
ncbi:MAG TPA: hypothetical protein VMH05_26020 [Bryobacteraceae bacterium]|nr:hypothetical protein [Bryobacteraceae bacterium]